jgi:hypothetical protein
VSFIVHRVGASRKSVCDWRGRAAAGVGQGWRRAAQAGPFPAVAYGVGAEEWATVARLGLGARRLCAGDRAAVGSSAADVHDSRIGGGAPHHLRAASPSWGAPRGASSCERERRKCGAGDPEGPCSDPACVCAEATCRFPELRDKSPASAREVGRGLAEIARRRAEVGA